MKACNQQQWLINQIQDKRQYEKILKMKEKIESNGDQLCAVTGDIKWDIRVKDENERQFQKTAKYKQQLDEFVKSENIRI